MPIIETELNSLTLKKNAYHLVKSTPFEAKTMKKATLISVVVTTHFTCCMAAWGMLLLEMAHLGIC